MKLSQAKILELVRLKNEGKTTYFIRKKMGVSIRRINQLNGEYLSTGIIPRLKKPGRKAKPIDENETRLVCQASFEFRASAVFLEQIIKVKHGYKISHNRIHRILLQEGLAKRLGYMPRKKDWIRYERRHSLAAVHMDWHQRADGKWVVLVEDDASRAILAMLECNSPTAEKSIEALQIALQHGIIREVITDHGSQFTSNREGKSSFEEFCLEKDIKHILCRVKHPQSNGKIEKLFHLYKRWRDTFANGEEFVNWYNNIRPHLSLKFEELETPWQAFLRKKRC